MKCYLIRHGMTEGNRSLNFSGCRTDEPLSPEGRDSLAAIDGVRDDALLYVSPMKRAVETASIMLPGVKPILVDDLREMDFGEFEGKNHAALDGDPRYQAWLDSGGLKRVPGGESIAEFGQRVAAAIGKVLRDAASKGAETVYIVAHGGTIMAAMNHLTGEDHYGFKTPNGAGYEVEVESNDAGDVLAAITYDRFCGGLRDGYSDWRPPQYTPSDKVDR